MNFQPFESLTGTHPILKLHSHILGLWYLILYKSPQIEEKVFETIEIHLGDPGEMGQLHHERKEGGGYLSSEGGQTFLNRYR